MMNQTTTTARVTREQLEGFCVEAMRRAGMTEADAHASLRGLAEDLGMSGAFLEK